MKTDMIQAAACFFVLMVGVLMSTHAAANGETAWALLFVAMGFVAALKMGRHTAAAVDAARCSRRPRRRTAEEWQRIIERVAAKQRRAR